MSWLKTAFLIGYEKAMRDAGISKMPLKLAASLDQLGAAARRIPNVHGTMPAGLEGVPAFTVPKPNQLKGPGAEALSNFQHDLFGHEAMQHLNTHVGPLVKQAPGRIYVNDSVGHMLAPGADASTREGVRDFTVLHEAQERKQPTAVPGSMHLAPRVLVDDFNMRSRMTGPGAQGVLNTMNPIRAAEDAHLRWQFSEVFRDPRAASFLNMGTSRVPKAMRSRFSRATPSLSLQQGHEIMQSQQEAAQRAFEAARRHNPGTGRLVRTETVEVPFHELPEDVRAAFLENQNVY